VIAATLLMALQMRHIAGQSLGFGQENRLLVTLRGQDLIDQVEVLENELSRNPRVLGVSQSASIMGGDFPINVMRVETNEGALTEVAMNHMPVAEDFLEVLGMEVAAGRNFSADTRTDALSAVLVNESLATLMGWEDPIGKRMLAGPLEGEVVGVIRNFNFRSLHSPVEPFALYQFDAVVRPN